MYRVALSAGLLVTLGACGLSTNNISSGFTEPSYSNAGTTTGSLGSGSTYGSTKTSYRGGGSSSSSDDKPVQVAKLDDKAPKGSYERATTGALSDRDYSHTALDPEKARDLINQYRHDKGLKPLKLDAELTAAAKAHSRDLAKWDRISHYGSDGSNPWDRVKRTGYHARLAAENVGTGQIDFQEVLRGWKQSPGHNKNLLLPDATQMGIALVSDPRTEFKSFWTLVIGAPM